jgi:hypothetical protein
MLDQRIDLSQASQHRRDKQARERAVARRQLGHRGMIIDRFIKRMLLPQHRADEIERRTSRGN